MVGLGGRGGQPAQTKDEQTRLDQLVETVAYAREHLGQNHAIREPLPVPAERPPRARRRVPAPSAAPPAARATSSPPQHRNTELLHNAPRKSVFGRFDDVVGPALAARRPRGAGSPSEPARRVRRIANQAIATLATPKASSPTAAAIAVPHLARR